MKRFFIMLTLIVSAMGMMGVSGCQQSDPLTYQQQFYKLESSYKVALTAAVRYKEECDEGRLLPGCQDNVKLILEAEEKTNSALETAKLFRGSNDPKQLEASLLLLEKALAELIARSTIQATTGGK